MASKKIERWLFANSLRIESILALLSLTFIFLKQAKISGSDELLMIFLSLLACFYFIIGKSFPKSQKWIASAAIQFTYISFSICTIGLLFIFLSLSGASEMVEIGTLMMVICGSVLLMLSITSKDKKYIPLIMRIGIFGVILAGFYIWARN